MSQSIFSQQEKINKFYEGMLEQDDGMLFGLFGQCCDIIILSLVHMKCIVCIGADYPQMPPTFAIEIFEDSGVREMHRIQIKVNYNINFVQNFNILLCRA